MIGQLRVWVNADKNSINTTIQEIQKIKKAWDDVEKSLSDSADKWMKKFKKEAENSLNTIAKLNDKIWNLKKDLESEIIWWKRFKELQKEIEKTEKALTKVTWWWNNFFWSLKNIWSVIAWVFWVYQIANFTKEVFNLTSRQQLLEKSFTTLTWSIEKAKSTLDEIWKIAKETPFNRLWISETTQKFIAFWFSVEQALLLVRATADATSALWWSQEVFDWIALAIWQIKAKWKVSAEELLQLTERGIPAYDILREKLWLTADQIANIWNEWISSSTAINALLEWILERYNWAAENASKTLAWRLSNIWDTIQLQLIKFWESITPIFDSILLTIDDFVNNSLPIYLISISNLINTIWESLVISGKWILSLFDIISWWMEKQTKDSLSFSQKLSIIYWIILNFFSNWLKSIVSFIKSIWWALWFIFTWIINNTQIFWKNFMTLTSNIIYNIWQWWKALPWIIAEALNSWLSKINDFFNWFVEKYNNTVWKILWNIDWWVNFKIDTSSFKENYRSLTEGVQEFQGIFDWYWDYLKESFSSTADDIWSDTEKVYKSFLNNTEKQTDNSKKTLQDKLKEVQELFKSDNNISSSWSSSWKSPKITQAEKEAKELQKLYEENYNEDVKLAQQRDERLKKLEDEKQKKYKESLKTLKEWYEDTWDVIDRVLKESEKNIDDFNKKIKESQDNIIDFKKELDNLEKWKTSNLWNRFVEVWDRTKEIQDELKKLQNEWVDLWLAQNLWLNTLKSIWWWIVFNNNQKVEDLLKVVELQKELNDLEKEKKIIENNVDSSVLTEAQRVANLSPTEKYLEEYEAKKVSIQNDIALEEWKVKEYERLKWLEQDIFDKFTKAKENLDNRYKVFKEELEAKITDNLVLETSKRLKTLQDFEIQATRIANNIRNSLNTATNSSWLTWGFSEWWYTGPGGKYEPAWIVHKWEYVIPQHVLRRMPDLVPNLEKVRIWWYNPSSNTYNNQKTISVWWITVQNKVDLENFFDKLKWKL